jgi:hypothetical protein
MCHGYDQESETFKIDKAITPPTTLEYETKFAKATEIEEETCIITSSKDVENVIEFESGIDLTQMRPVTFMNYTRKLLNKLQIGECTFVGSAIKTFPSKFLKEYTKKLRLEEKAKELLMQPDGKRKFRERYGTHFICGLVNQASVTVSVSKEQASCVNYKGLTFVEAMMYAWNGDEEKLSKQVGDEIINLGKVDRFGAGPNSKYHNYYSNPMHNLRAYLEDCKEGQPVFYIACLYDMLEDFQKLAMPVQPHPISESVAQEIFSEIVKLEYYKARFSALPVDEQEELKTSGIGQIFEELTNLVHSYKLVSSKQLFNDKLKQVKQIWNDYAKNCHETANEKKFEPKRAIYAWKKKSAEKTEEEKPVHAPRKKSAEFTHSYPDISEFSPKNKKLYHEEAFLFRNKEDSHAEDVSEEAYNIIEKSIENYLKEIQKNVDPNMIEKVKRSLENKIINKLGSKTNTYDNLSYDIENLVRESDIKNVLAQIQIPCLKD